MGHNPSEKWRGKISDGNNFNTESTGDPQNTVRNQAALAADATFTGEWEKNDYPDVMVSCFSDTAGTLYFDFSVDGTNARTFPSSGFAV